MIYITIHRGASQIGGCITEIKTQRAKILIDLGCNLPGSGKEDFTPEDIKRITSGVDAIFYTHYHGDHVGFLADVDKDIPQFIGKGAKEIMLCKYNALAAHGDYSKELEAVERMKTYIAGEEITRFGDIVITPYYCSHSAFDAYMFKIEAEGKTILHTGDFRGHGYMGSKLIPMLNKYVKQVDVLVTEGTMLSRTTGAVKTERDIQKEVAEVLKKHKYVFALGSSTDIDRLASFHAACKQTDRYFYVDRFQESVLDVFTKYTTSSLYDFSNKGKGKTIFVQWEYWHHKKESIVNEMKRRGFLMPIRCSAEYLVKSMNTLYTDEKPVLIYSMWNGYWKGTKEQKLESVLNVRSLFDSDSIYEIHTSGHADCSTLSEVCLAVNPRLAIIPIHRDKDTDYRSLQLPECIKEKVTTQSASIQGVEIIIK